MGWLGCGAGSGEIGRRETSRWWKEGNWELGPPSSQLKQLQNGSWRFGDTGVLEKFKFLAQFGRWRGVIFGG